MCSPWCTHWHSTVVLPVAWVSKLRVKSRSAFCILLWTSRTTGVWLKQDVNLSLPWCALPHAREPAMSQGWCAHCRASGRAAPAAAFPSPQEYPPASIRDSNRADDSRLSHLHRQSYCLEPYYNIIPTVVTHRHLGIEAQHLFHYSRGINFPEVLTNISMINLSTSVWAVKLFWTLKTGFF